jgi:hypothetical protein
MRTVGCRTGSIPVCNGACDGPQVLDGVDWGGGEAAFSRVGTSWTGGCGRLKGCVRRREPDVTSEPSCRKLG